jgi:hypothetical protein
MMMNDSNQVTTGPVRCWRVVRTLLSVGLALSVGCGESQVVEPSTEARPTQEDVDELEQATRDWYESRDTIVMPWTRVLEADLVASSVVEQDMISFPLERRDDIDHVELYDIVASELAEAPFLRRVAKIEETDTHIVWHTEHVTIEEAVFKGSLTSDDRVAPGQLRRLDDDSDGVRTRRFRSEATFSNKLDEGEHVESTQDYTIKGGPFFDVDVEADMELEIGGAMSRKYPGPDCPDECSDPTEDQCDCTYTGTADELPCDLNSDCAMAEYCVGASHCAYEAGKNYWGTSSSDNENWGERVSAYEFETAAKHCGDIVAAVEAITHDEECNRRWNVWLKGNNRSCRGMGCGYWSCHPESDELADRVTFPTPAQVSWAKRECSGFLRKFELDVAMTPKVGIKDLELQVSRSRKASADHKIAPRSPFWQDIFMLGNLPVWVTFRGELEFKVEAEAKVGVGVAFEDIEYGITFRNGFHYYGTESIAQAGQYAAPNEEPKSFLPNHYDTDYPQEVSSGSFGIKKKSDGSPERATVDGEPVEDKDGDGELTLADFVEAEVKLGASASSKLKLSLYDSLGAFWVPMKAAGEIRYNNTEQCEFGAEVGLGSQIGLEASIPLCPNCEFSASNVLWEWNSCDGYDYCSQDTAPLLCTKKCLWGCNSGDGGNNAEKPDTLVIYVDDINDADYRDQGQYNPPGFDISYVALEGDFDGDPQIHQVRVYGDGTYAEYGEFPDDFMSSCPSSEAEWSNYAFSGHIIEIEFDQPLVPRSSNAVVQIKRPRTTDGCTGSGVDLQLSTPDGGQAATFFGQGSTDAVEVLAHIGFDPVCSPNDTSVSDRLCWDF